MFSNYEYKLTLRFKNKKNITDKRKEKIKEEFKEYKFKKVNEVVVLKNIEENEHIIISNRLVQIRFTVDTKIKLLVKKIIDIFDVKSKVSIDEITLKTYILNENNEKIKDIEKQVNIFYDFTNLDKFPFTILPINFESITIYNDKIISFSLCTSPKGLYMNFEDSNVNLENLDESIYSLNNFVENEFTNKFFNYIKGDS